MLTLRRACRRCRLPARADCQPVTCIRDRAAVARLAGVRRVAGRRVALWLLGLIVTAAVGSAAACSGTAERDQVTPEIGPRVSFGRVVVIVFENQPPSAVL